jgi:hypothetical protein
MLVAPDTSPRSPRLPGDDASWDFGQGAGFYVDSTVAPWSSHYQMYSYVTSELPALINENFRHWRIARASSGIRWAVTVRWCARCATRALQVGFGVRADLGADALPMGPEGVHGLSRVRPDDLGRLRRQPDRLTRRVSQSDPDRPGNGGQISAGAAAARAVR